MNVPGSPAFDPEALPRAAAALGPISLGPGALTAGALVALGLTALFALLRNALQQALPDRILRGAVEERRARLRRLLERAETLAIGASLVTFASQLVFIGSVLAVFAPDGFSWGEIGLAVLLCVPALVLVEELIPRALRGERSDAFLRAFLPGFDLVQRLLLLGPVAGAFEAAQRAFLRFLRVPDRSQESRHFVEGLLDEAGRGELGASEREFIENALEFPGIDVTEVMTPRTELTAVEVGKGLDAVVRAIAESGHSRIPVFEGNLDTIIGVAYAQEILQLLAQGDLEGASLRNLLRPVPFVPETKLVTQLLSDFRRENQKIAVVLDEYGGTSGIVTVGDIVEEIVGDMPNELGATPPEEIQRLDDGTALVHGTTRVSELNEELDLSLPEEQDYETVAGFVLSELGRFPKPGESFAWNGLRFGITQATDRRVLEVHLQRLASGRGKKAREPRSATAAAGDRTPVRPGRTGTGS